MGRLASSAARRSAGAVRVLVGFDDARTHRIDPDALGRHFAGQPDRQRVERRLGGGIGAKPVAAELGNLR
jgi:hypothetical protein